MTALKIDRFGGMIPRLPAERLPEGAAQEAVNCNLSHGELRSLAGPAPRIATTQAVRSLFTDDGLRFYAWPVPTRAYLSPTVDDVHGRVYYSNPSDGLCVALTSGMHTALSNPRPPAQKWRVGVARPASPPAVSIHPTAAWGGDAGAVIDIRGVSRVVGAEVREIVPSSVTQDVRWLQYTVTLPADEVPVEGVATSSKLIPSGGWITLPEPLVAHFDPALTYSEFIGGEMALVSVPVLTLNAGVARLDAAGRLRAPLRPGVSAGTYTPQSVVYGGKAWAPAALYAALVNGTAGNSSAADALAHESLSFKARVINPATNKVYWEGEATFTMNGSTYIVRPQYPDSLAETVAYVTTFESDWGEESAPSDPVTVTLMPYQDAKIAQRYTPLAGARPIAGMNLYRTYAGSNTTYLKANLEPRTEREGADWVIWDATVRPVTSVALVTQEWDPPPDHLHGLTYAGNGFFAGAAGKDLRLSEPYRPHAWPYYMTFPHAIIGVIAVEGGLLVTTTAQPYLVYGPHPEQMTQQALNAEQAGVSVRAMTRIEGSAVYASNDGLVTVSGGHASIKPSQQLFTRNDWRGRYKHGLRNMVLGAWDGMLLGAVDPSYPGAMVADAFLLRMDEEPSFSKLDVSASGGAITGFAVSDTTDELYLLYANGFAEFGAGAALPLSWRSRVYEFPRPVVFGAGIVDCDGSFMVTVMADDAAVLTLSIIGSRSFRLPAVGARKKWLIEIRGTGTLRSIELGTSFRELQHV